MRTLIAVTDLKGGNVVPKLINALEREQISKNSCFGLATPIRSMEKTSLEKLKATKTTSSFAFGYVVTNNVAETSPFILKTENGTFTFEGRVFSDDIKNNPEKTIKNNLQVDPAKTAESILKGVEGEFASIAIQEGCIIAARDPVGVQPLYYGTSKDSAIVASNRKVLWRMGIEGPISFPPGSVATFSEFGCKFQPVKGLEFQKPKSITMDEAAGTLKRLLETSIRRRVSDQKKIAIAFSGGLDSSVVAWLAKKTGIETSLIHVSLENQKETEEAKKAAEALELPLSVFLYKETDIEKDISKIIEIVEDPEPIMTGVGMPFYWTAQKAAEAGFHVMLAGQGADELFGGYLRYVKEYISKGDEAYRQTMFHDLVTIHESNLERDEKVCSYWDVQLRIPFGSTEIAQFALSLPTNLKFEKRLDSPRKLVLRKAAELMGMTKELSEKPKKAVQYSTGINTALERIAKRNNQTLKGYTRKLFQEMKHKSIKN